MSQELPAKTSLLKQQSIYDIELAKSLNCSAES